MMNTPAMIFLIFTFVLLNVVCVCVFVLMYTCVTPLALRPTYKHA